MNKELFNAEGFDSKEELWFNYYLSELKQHGFVESFEHHPETFVLTDEYRVHVFIKKKKYNEPKEIKLLNKLEYTPDFLIHWNKKAKDLIYWVEGGQYETGSVTYSKPRRERFIPFKAETTGTGDIISTIDVKGAQAQQFNRNNNSAITFPIIQRWMCSKGIYVQKVPVSLCEKGLFYRTWFPRVVVSEEVYKRDCKWGKEGETKIKVEIKLIEQWLREKTGERKQ